MVSVKPGRLAYEAMQRWSQQVSPGWLRSLGNLRWSISRSSGPGGQHVNKVNTKACLHFSLNSLPATLQGHLRAKRHQWLQGEQIIIRSDEHRHLIMNQEECLQRLADWLREEALQCCPRPPDEEQVAKIKAM